MSALIDQVRDIAANATAPDWPAWATQLRERGAQAFIRHGLPNARVEAWKYTPLNRRPFGDVVVVAGERATDLPEPVHGLGDVTRLVFIDGVLAGVDGELPKGVNVTALAEAIAADASRNGEAGELAEWLAEPPTEHAGDALSALNAATLGAGAVITVEPGVNAGRIALEWHATATGRGTGDQPLVNSRLCVALGEGVRLSLHECFATDGDSYADHNLITQVRLSKQAQLTHSRLQTMPAEHMLIAANRVDQDAESHYQYDGLDLGAGLARHDLFTCLAGEGARCDLNGAYLPRGEAHVDYHLAVEHRAEHCTSSQFFRGVVDDHAKAVWNGRVHVLPGADNTEALQSNANLLLSRDAEVDTKPELEIEADEVVASHGATVGQLDETAIFYLRSRGLDEALARELLIGAYCQAAVDRAGDEAVRERLTTELARYTGVGE